jgi:hypothetical protein
MFTAAQARKIAKKVRSEGIIYDFIKTTAQTGATTVTVAVTDYNIDLSALLLAGFSYTMSSDNLSITINW